MTLAVMVFHVCRKDKKIIDVKVLRKILKSARFVTIAMCMDNQPYLVSLSHGYDEDRNCIYFHCANEGKKLVYLNKNNSVWGQALLDYGYVEGECDHNYATVHFLGKVTFIDNLEEKHSAVKCMIKHLDKNPEPLIVKLNPERLGKAVIGRIDISYISGKKSKGINI
ncbi:pyridoxamine 5'-phosphate oxidase family protein [Candidatus Bathyarchaeota archaeon]|nr:pyridoxamine 5'-phosphate oxidase family protein [Candidatus Bathyarchaeota archaeon]